MKTTQRKITPTVFVVPLTALLAACGAEAPSASTAAAPPAPAPAAAPADTVSSLMQDHKRLKSLSQHCKLNSHSLDDVLCNRVAEANNRLFFNKGLPEDEAKKP